MTPHILAIPATAFLMRAKGGGPDIAPKWFRDLDGATVSAFLFAGMSAILVSPLQAAFMGLAWFIGNKPSMGEEAGAIGGYRGNWYTDRDSWFGAKWFSFIKSDKVWGWASGAARGLFLGLLLAVSSFNPWFALTGALFPVAYFIGISIEQAVLKKDGRASWHYGEWIYGAILGTSFLLAL